MELCDQLRMETDHRTLLTQLIILNPRAVQEHPHSCQAEDKEPTQLMDSVIGPN